MTEETSGDRNIDRRMEEIAGQPQRIAPLAEDALGPEAHAIAIELRKAFGIPENGAMPEVMRTMLVHPALFQGQMAIGLALGNGAIPPRDRELAVLRNAWLCGAPYEWGEHVNIAKRLGVTSEEIERCTQGSKAEGWNRHEQAVLKGVEEFHADHMLSDATWAALAETWDERQLMEFPVLVGTYIATALQQNTLRMTLQPDNPGLAHR